MDPTVDQRVCAAIVRDGHILMVRHRESGRAFWTLPGGTAEPGETLAQAAVREVAEEVRLAGDAGPVLYERAYVSVDGRPVRETCFLVRVPAAAEPILGHDPELPEDAQVLAEVCWFALDAVREDRQVSRALPTLRTHLTMKDRGLA
ncbi:NUDIX domain-containing protein [Actinopolymorpha alba]|uniref:NUDIX domain-containing protein n=1 Tax=Actinopolymorpha alba TaxID=533267 RepID=UPI0003806026|nr:NUDIX domain-containing protein [Actinopolymorpha alba]